MKTKYKKFYILEKHASIKDGSTEALYYARIDGKDEWNSREDAQRALNSKYEAHERQRAQSSKPWGTRIHKTADSYSYNNWETRYIYKVVEL